jgi:hypothetical protein
MAKKRKGIAKSRHQPFLAEYSFEIKVVILFALGIFLLVEELEIKYYIYTFIRLIFFSIGNGIEWARDSILFLIKQFEVSDIVGISLIVYVIYLIANRWRERMINRFSDLSNCPECGGELNRIRKNWNHKLLGFIYWANVKNYHCKLCSYKGIKLIK